MRVNIVTLRGVWGAIALGTFGVACNGDDDFPRPEPETQDEWSWVERSEGAALLSVHGTASDDVWFSGADDGAAMSSAVGALSGPLHGGAPARVLTMLDEVAA